MDFSGIKAGKYIVVKNRPCKILKVDHRSPGRHGPARKKVWCKDLITDKKIESIFKHSSIIDVPLISKNTFDVLDICDNTITYFTDSDYITIDMAQYDSEIYEKAFEQFEKGDELTVNVMHIKFEMDGKEFYRVVDVSGRK